MGKDDVDAFVDQWFTEHFRGGYLARAGTEAWNEAFAAKEDLKRRLRERLVKSED